ncbi:hypothetical protein Csa_002692 [Cucumis sativus]|nr:hypothetical protein Csa_002692 [Cucumis sativus]
MGGLRSLRCSNVLGHNNRKGAPRNGAGHGCFACRRAFEYIRCRMTRPTPPKLRTIHIINPPTHMAVVVLDGSTVRNFVNDESHFNKSIDDAFASLDLNNDGVLSRSELRKAFETLRLIETHFGVDVATTPEQLTQLYDSIFEQFDCDKSGTVDAEEFRTEMKNILLAIADGLGSSPIQMALDDGDQSFLKQAADLEASKLRQSST